LLSYLRTPYIKFLFSLALLIAALVLLNTSIAGIAPLGKILNPYSGLWRTASDRLEIEPELLRVPGLQSSVSVSVDQDRVLHIFAKNEADLYFAQGFLQARDRLWQMDFLTRVASGRLSEIFGARTIPVDKMFIEMGLGQAAKDSVDLMMQDDLTHLALQNYTAGVNAYIAKLKEKDDPFEFKLLGYRAEAWSPYKSALLMKFMAFQLAGHSRDLLLTRSRGRLSEDDFNELFPIFPKTMEPIMPKGSHWAQSIPLPQAPYQSYQASEQALKPATIPHPENGSNNWAVMGQKSTTGLPILSNDVHLDYSLPALWYQVQLISPQQNVYGVTIPGAPGVVLGFNRKLAWAVTNGGDDVMDWFELRFRDENRREYLFDGKWRPVISTEHVLKVRGQKDIVLNLKQTHFGPIVYPDYEKPLFNFVPRGLALKWGVLEASNELRTFLLLNHARQLSECREAIATFQTPAQNFICADNHGDVGQFHQGRFPLRWKGQGRLIGDGSNSEYDWKGWIPNDEIPYTINPDRGFVSSANQPPADEKYPYYLGSPFELPYRGERINEILKSKQRFSPEDFRNMQGDNLSIPARTLLPDLLAIIKTSGDGLKTPAAKRQQILDILQDWDFHHEPSSVAGSIYAEWYKQLEKQIWEDKFPDRELYQYPQMSSTIDMITQNPNSKWFDKRDTEQVETLSELAHLSFDQMVDELTKTLGPDTAKWTWGRYQPTHFRHLGKIPGLGVEGLAVQGQGQDIFANTGTHGPVWKMVVALGKEAPQAWGIFPGGQSGNPSSLYYDNFLTDWSLNRMHELWFLTDPGRSNSHIVHDFTMQAL
jgi:penicillin amidase